MTQDRAAPKPELTTIRAEFGDTLALEVVSLLLRQFAEQAMAYGLEVEIDWDTLTSHLRDHVRQQAVMELAQLRLTAQLN